jgi:hypothetical protein
MIEVITVDSAVALSIRWILAVVFSVALIHKLMSPAAFVATLKAYRLLPSYLLYAVAYALIAAELITVIALIGNSSLGSTAAAMLLTIYTTAIGVNLLRGRRDIDCGCAGPYVRQTLSVWLLVRNSGFIVLALASLMNAGSSRALGALDIFTALATSLSFALLYFAVNQIVTVNARYGDKY